jgi:glycosyltransferase involved in cell wall biosynthesis
MRILLITTSFLPRVGGAEFVVHHLAQEWCRQGHEVRVINAVTSDVPQSDALYSVRRFRMLRGSTRFGAHRLPYAWHGSRQLWRAIDAYRPDAISAHFGYPTAIWLARICPTPRFLITDHGPALNVTPRGPRQRFGISNLIAESLNASIGAVALSSHARQVMEQIGVASDKIVDIPNGVDVERFGRRISDFNLRARLGLPVDATVILSVGRESWAKAYDVGIRAFGAVASQVPGTYYVILGSGATVWQPLARELGLADRVIFCEGLYGDELIGAYQQADVFFLPSVKELCPLVVLEAMAAGLAEVVTNVSGSQDMVQDGVNGFVIEPGDVTAMASRLVQLVEDRRLRKQMGQASLVASPRYGWDRISREYLAHM